MILNYNGCSLLEKFLPSVLEAVEYDGGDHEIIVIDNASTDNSIKFLNDNYPDVIVKRMSTNNFLFSYNEVVRECKKDYVVLLNTDIKVEKGFILPLLKHFDDPEVFAVMPKINDNSTDGWGYGNRRYGVFKHGNLVSPLDSGNRHSSQTIWAHGGAAAYDRNKFIMLGGFNSIFKPMYGEDDDLSYAAWMHNYKIMFEPGSEVFHLGASTTKRYYSCKEIKRIREKSRMVFILKNISDRRMLISFIFFSLLRSVKALFTFKLYLVRAVYDTILSLTGILHARRTTQTNRMLSDREILNKIANG